MKEPSASENFRWACLGVAMIFGFVLIWMIWDFKQKMVTALAKAESTVGHVQKSVEEVNNKMPAVLGEIQKTSHTLSRVADDVELMKRVTGINNENEERGVRGLAIYADELQQVLADETEGKNSNILVEEVIGNDLKVHESMPEFLVSLNKEMVAILVLAKSREEILYRVCHSSIRRKPYFLQINDAEPILLEDFIRKHHATSDTLPSFSKD